MPAELWKTIVDLQTHPISSNLGAKFQQNDDIKKANSEKLKKLLADLAEE